MSCKTNKVLFMDLRIKEYMSQSKVSSALLAEKVGISKVAISNIITGKSLPSLENLMKIAQVLNVSVSQLIGEEESPKNQITCPKCGAKFELREVE